MSLRAATHRVDIAAVVLVLDRAVAFHVQVLLDGPERSHLPAGDHNISLPGAILPPRYALPEALSKVARPVAVITKQRGWPSRRERRGEALPVWRRPPY